MLVVYILVNHLIHSALLGSYFRRDSSIYKKVPNSQPAITFLKATLICNLLFKPVISKYRCSVLAAIIWS